MDKDMDKDARIADLEHTVRVLLDRQEIYDCLVRYARGVDRGDLELLLTAYHTDAMADCGAICASAAEMSKWSIENHNARQFRTQHLIGNHTFDIRGDVADTETYWHYGGFNKPPLAPVSLMGGRYLDHFERRGGKWAIAHRKVLVDWHGNAGEHLPLDVIEGFNSPVPPSRSLSDPSYTKPYKILPERLGLRATHVSI
jgi:hypothetical protein